MLSHLHGVSLASSASPARPLSLTRDFLPHLSTFALTLDSHLHLRILTCLNVIKLNPLQYHKIWVRLDDFIDIRKDLWRSED